MFHIGNAIIHIREERKLTQGQLAEAAGIRPNTLVDLEKMRKKTRLETLEKVASALGMTIPEVYLKLDELTGKPIAKPAPSALSACCEAHIKECELLHKILTGKKWWADGIKSNLEAMHLASTGSSPPERDRLPVPGDSIITEHTGAVIVPGAEHGKSKRKIDKR